MHILSSLAPDSLDAHTRVSGYLHEHRLVVVHSSIAPSHPTSLHILAVNARRWSVVVMAFLDLLLSVVVDVLDVEGVDAMTKLASIIGIASMNVMWRRAAST